VAARGAARAAAAWQSADLLRLPRPAKRPPAGTGWIHETKHAGFRIVAYPEANGGNGGPKWIEKGGGYYSQCNKRLKGQA